MLGKIIETENAAAPFGFLDYGFGDVAGVESFSTPVCNIGQSGSQVFLNEQVANIRRFPSRIKNCGPSRIGGECLIRGSNYTRGMRKHREAILSIIDSRF